MLLCTTTHAIVHHYSCFCGPILNWCYLSELVWSVTHILVIFYKLTQLVARVFRAPVKLREVPSYLILQHTLIFVCIRNPFITNRVSNLKFWRHRKLKIWKSKYAKPDFFLSGKPIFQSFLLHFAIMKHSTGFLIILIMALRREYNEYRA